MTEPPTSSDLTRLVHEALNQPEPWTRRILDAIRRAPSAVARVGGRILNLLRRLPATLARMGGYWGGVTMRWRNKP